MNGDFPKCVGEQDCCFFLCLFHTNTYTHTLVSVWVAGDLTLNWMYSVEFLLFFYLFISWSQKVRVVLALDSFGTLRVKQWSITGGSDALWFTLCTACSERSKRFTCLSPDIFKWDDNFSLGAIFLLTLSLNRQYSNLEILHYTSFLLINPCMLIVAYNNILMNKQNECVNHGCQTQVGLVPTSIFIEKSSITVKLLIRIPQNPKMKQAKHNRSVSVVTPYRKKTWLCTHAILNFKLKKILMNYFLFEAFWFECQP